MSKDGFGAGKECHLAEVGVGGLRREANEDVEVIAPDAERHALDAAKSLVAMKEFYEFLAFLFPQHKLPVYHA